jgi:hypothetical protein
LGDEELMNKNPTIQCCSVNGKVCRDGRRDDFPEDPRTGVRFLCNEWVNVRGKHPQSEEIIDNWMCARFASILMQMEQAQQTRQAAASSDKTATEVRRHHQTFYAALNDDARERLLKADQAEPMIEQKGV